METLIRKISKHNEIENYFAINIVRRDNFWPII